MGEPFGVNFLVSRKFSVVQEHDPPVNRIFCKSDFSHDKCATSSKNSGLKPFPQLMLISAHQKIQLSEGCSPEQLQELLQRKNRRFGKSAL